METKNQGIGLAAAPAGKNAADSAKKKWAAPTLQELDASQTESGEFQAASENTMFSYYPPGS